MLLSEIFRFVFDSIPAVFLVDKRHSSCYRAESSAETGGWPLISRRSERFCITELDRHLSTSANFDVAGFSSQP